MGFPRQEYCGGLSFPYLGDLPNPEVKPRSPALQADSLPSEPPGKPLCVVCVCKAEKSGTGSGGAGADHPGLFPVSVSSWKFTAILTLRT